MNTSLGLDRFASPNQESLTPDQKHKLLVLIQRYLAEEKSGMQVSLEEINAILERHHLNTTQLAWLLREIGINDIQRIIDEHNGQTGNNTSTDQKGIFSNRFKKIKGSNWKIFPAICVVLYLIYNPFSNTHSQSVQSTGAMNRGTSNVMYYPPRQINTQRINQELPLSVYDDLSRFALSLNIPNLNSDYISDQLLPKNFLNTFDNFINTNQLNTEDTESVLGFIDLYKIALQNYATSKDYLMPINMIDTILGIQLHLLNIMEDHELDGAFNNPPDEG